MVRVDLLWELADDCEAKARDKDLMPVERYVWRNVHQSLVQRLGDRP